jgi:hypothetical protein
MLETTRVIVLRLLRKGARPLTASDAKLNILDEAHADARNAVAPELPWHGIRRGQMLNVQELTHVVAAIERWLRRNAAEM